ncbi:hypothetical protein M8494_09800 [Serratia ureilytica]
MEGHGEHDEIITHTADDNEKFSALAFKLTDPFVGQPLTFVRVYSGCWPKAAAFLTRSRAKRSASAASCRCANVVKDIDRRCTPATSPPRRPEGRHHRRYAVRSRRHHHAGTHDLPRTGDRQAIEPKTKGDGENGHRCSASLRKIRRSACAPMKNRPDPYLRHGRAAPGDYRRSHAPQVGVETTTGKPAGVVPQPSANGWPTWRQVCAPSHRAGQYGHVVLTVEQTDGEGFRFFDEIKGGVIPGGLSAVKKSVLEAR